jgi:DNA-directed RNA polymerase subunit RPC12/RpoP
MSLSVTCSDCDKSLKVKDELAGKKIRCPGCSSVIAIPQPATDDDELPDEWDEPAPAKRKRRAADNDELDDEEPVARPRSRSSKPVKKKGGRSKSKGPNILLLIGAIVGGLIAVLFVIGMFVAAFNQARISASRVAENWTTFRHPLGIAQVDMPGVPTFNAAQSQNGVQTYLLAKPMYQMSLTGIQFAPDVQQALKLPGTVDLMFGEIEKKTPTQMPGARVLSTRRITGGSMPAMEMKVEVKGNINLMRFYLAPNALFGAEFISRDENKYAAQRERFFKSLCGPDGSPVDGPAQPPGMAQPHGQPGMPQPHSMPQPPGMPQPHGQPAAAHMP